MSEEEIEYELPLDILIEIFKRLTVKSLIRFRSVSKTWKSVIQSSRFIADYNCRHIQPHQFFVGDDYQNYVDIFNDDDADDISFLQRLTLPMAEHTGFDYNKLISYSQGLFGFHCYNFNYVNDSVVIWNPSIRKSVFIPIPKSKSPDQIVVINFTVCNATDPTIFKITYRPGLHVEIFTLSTGAWRTLSIAPPRESPKLALTKGVVIDNRFIHWIASDRTPEGDYLDNLLLSFDITSEQFTELCLPPSLATHTSLVFFHLSELRESLVVIQEDVCKQEFGVWMMMEPGVQNSFTKLYTVKPPYRREFPTVLGFRKNGQLIIYSDFPSYKDTLLFYESDLKRFNDIEISRSNPSTAGSYMETLLLLDH